MKLDVRRYENLLDTLPYAQTKLELNDPQKGITELHKLLENQQRYPFTKIVKSTAKKSQQKVEKQVQSWLERLANQIPKAEFDRLIRGASKLTGKLAFAVTAIGLSLLIMASAKEVLAGVNVEQNKTDSSFIIERETGEQVIFIPLNQLDKFKLSSEENKLFNKFNETNFDLRG